MKLWPMPPEDDGRRTAIGLAPVAVDRIGELLLEISRSGVDILVVAQNAEMALNLADRAYILEEGRVIASDDAGVISRRANRCRRRTRGCDRAVCSTT